MDWCINGPPTMAFGWFHARPTGIEPVTGGFRFRAPKGPPLSYTGFEGPRALKLFLLLFTNPPTTAFR